METERMVERKTSSSVKGPCRKIQLSKSELEESGRTTR